MANGESRSIQIMPTGGRLAELNSDEGPYSFLESYGIIRPGRALPISEFGILCNIDFAPGASEATLTIPIENDGVHEPSKGVLLLLEALGDPVVPLPIEPIGLIPEP